MLPISELCEIPLYQKVESRKQAANGHEHDVERQIKDQGFYGRILVNNELEEIRRSYLINSSCFGPEIDPECYNDPLDVIIDYKLQTKESVNRIFPGLDLSQF